MRVAWRLVKARHRGSAFDGQGARQWGGRWNHRGTAVIYTSGSLALAALETFVHLGAAARALSFLAFRLQVPPSIIQPLDIAGLPAGWRDEPAPESTRAIGSRWATRRASAVLEVPSVIIPVETNLLLNPAHPGFRKISIDPPEPFSFDPRMWMERS